jgi:FtsH-binding integral membrane protein
MGAARTRLQRQEQTMGKGYGKLALAMCINTVLMYFITYAMIDSIDHFYFNFNRLYMAVMMAAPMGVVMLLVMGSMYPKKKLNLLLYAFFIGLFAVTFSLARTQTPIGNQQFLRSMIPHHSSAIVMCQQSDISDPEIGKLCREIVKTQREEIAQMKDMLAQK